MEMLAIGLSMICLVYIFLLYAIHFSFRFPDAGQTVSAKWTKISARLLAGLKRWLNKHLGRGSGDMAY